MFVSQLIVFVFHLFIKYLNEKAFLDKSKKLQDKIIFVPVVNTIFSFMIIIAFIIALLGNLFDYLRVGQYLDEKENQVVYTLGHLQKTSWKSSRGNSYYKGSFSFNIGSKKYELETKIPDEYENYIYLIKVNIQETKYAKAIPILIEDIPKDTAFYTTNFEKQDEFTAYPIQVKTYAGYNYKIKTNSLNGLKLIDGLQNFIKLPTLGWRENPISSISLGDKQRNTLIKEWIIRVLSLLTSIYSLYVFFKEETK